jgi:hypothetical protein
MLIMFLSGLKKALKNLNVLWCQAAGYPVILTTASAISISDVEVQQ